MKKRSRERICAPIMGGSALLVIFAVLCLVVFALLSLSTVQAQRRLSNAAMEATAAYYRADLEAERIFAQLRSSETIPGVRQEDGVYAYSRPISENQALMVELVKNDDTWKILRWQSVAQQIEIDDTLPVWDGT